MRVLFFAIGLALAAIAGAQQEPARSTTKDHREHSTRFGFKGGYNRSDISGLETDGDKTGYIGGELYGSFFMDSKLTDRLNFENELLFSWTDDYHFIEIPLHLKYGFLKKWKVFAGPKLDFIVDDDNESFERNYKFRNFGVSAELGLQFHFWKRFLVESRYSNGFTKQVTNLGLDINGGKRNTFRVGAGIIF